jgi:undecaprenyl pyrophosphate phosphatase UppP
VVWFLPGVDPEVRFEVSLLVKSPLAILIGTHEVFESNMYLQMNVQLLLSAVALGAAFVSAPECLELIMRLKVIVQMAFCHEGFTAVTHGAGKGSYYCLINM